MRDGFIIHEKTLRMAKRLSAEDIAYLWSCLQEVYETGDIDLDHVEEISPIVAVVLEDAVERMNADAEAYDEAVQRRKAAGQKGAEARWRKHATAMAEDGKRMRSHTDRIESQCDEMAGDGLSVSVSDSVSDIKETSSDASHLQKERKHKHGEFGKVLLTDDEYKRLQSEFGADADKAISFLDAYIAEKGYKSKSHNLAIRRWVIQAVREKEAKARSGANKWAAKVESRSYDMDDLEARIMAAQGG